MKIFARKNLREKERDNIGGHLAIQLKLNNDYYVIHSLPDLSASVITSTPLSTRKWEEYENIYVVGTKSVGELLDTLRFVFNGEKYNFVNMSILGDLGNSIASIGAAKFYLESSSEELEKSRDENDENHVWKSQEIQWRFLVHQCERYKELEPYLKENQQATQSIWTQLKRNDLRNEFKEKFY